MRARRERHFDPAIDRLSLVGIIGIPGRLQSESPAVFVRMRSSTSELQRAVGGMPGAPRAIDCD
jgi:hypothetical protein